MAKKIWEDATSYSRNKDRIQTAWQIETNHLRIYITNSHIHNRGAFTMHCYQLGIDTLDIGIPGDDVKKAQERAIEICRSKAEAFVYDLKNL